MPRAHVREVKQAVPRRVVLIEVIAAIAHAAWRDGTNPTPLTFEGAFWASLRAGLILTYGLPWPVAHQAAGDIVGEGLRRAGGKRPSWHEGQPEHRDGGVIRDTREACANCEKPLEVGQRTFCGKLCFDAHRARQWRENNLEAARAVDRAKSIKRRAAGEREGTYARSERWRDAARYPRPD